MKSLHFFENHPVQFWVFCVVLCRSYFCYFSLSILLYVVWLPLSYLQTFLATIIPFILLWFSVRFIFCCCCVECWFSCLITYWLLLSNDKRSDFCLYSWREKKYKWVIYDWKTELVTFVIHWCTHLSFFFIL